VGNELRRLVYGLRETWREKRQQPRCERGS